MHKVKITQGQLQLSANNVRILCEHKDALRKYYATVLKSASLFMMLFDTNDVKAIRKTEALCQQISSRFDVKTSKIVFADLPWVNNASRNLLLLRFDIHNIAPEVAKKEIENIICNQSDKNKDTTHKIRISKYGLFIPRTGAITCYSFAHGHGYYYRFRIATFKLDTAPTPLSKFLYSLPTCCPNRYFLSGPRASNFNMSVDASIKSSSAHPIIKFAQEGLKNRLFKSNHEKIEKYMLDNDTQTIATEVPVWFEPSELEEYGIPKSRDGCTLTGHIDILRLESGDIIGIWDYKPCAKPETKMHVQVYLYALMLSERTGLSIDHFRCGYFDTHIAFYFSPSEGSCALPT